MPLSGRRRLDAVPRMRTVVTGIKSLGIAFAAGAVKTGTVLHSAAEKENVPSVLAFFNCFLDVFIFLEPFAAGRRENLGRFGHWENLLSPNKKSRDPDECQEEFMLGLREGFQEGSKDLPGENQGSGSSK